MVALAGEEDFKIKIKAIIPPVPWTYQHPKENIHSRNHKWRAKPRHRGETHVISY